MTFTEPAPGPLAPGFAACHFGLGLFVATKRGGGELRTPIVPVGKVK